MREKKVGAKRRFLKHVSIKVKILILFYKK